MKTPANDLTMPLDVSENSASHSAACLSSDSDFYAELDATRNRQSSLQSATSDRASFQIDVTPSITTPYIVASFLIPATSVLVAGTVAAVYGNPNCHPNPWYLQNSTFTDDDGDDNTVSYLFTDASLPLKTEAECDSERNVFTYCGAALSIMGAVAVIISARLMPHWRQHPNTLVYYKMVADLLLAVVTCAAQHKNHTCSTHDHVEDPGLFPCDHCTKATALWTQFSVMSSETWFFIMAIDGYFSLQNPFSSFKEKYPYYHILAWGMGLITATFLVVRDDEGSSSADICWVDDTIDSDDFIERNANGFMYLYAWLVLFYTISLLVFGLTMCRINGGLKTTYHSRRNVLVRTAVILLIYMLYWFIMGVLFLSMTDDTVGNPDADMEWFKRTKPDHNAATGAIWFLLPAKGFVTAVVWFSVNSLPSLLYHTFSSAGREELRIKKELFVGGDFSPQLNKALRREVLHFTTKGIIEAVSRNPNRPPSSWSMNALASNMNIAEFDLELEPDEIAHVEERAEAAVKEGADKLPKLDWFCGWILLARVWHRLCGCEKSPSALQATRRVKFKDYCPHVFARIRAAEGVSVGSYVKSLKRTAKEKLSAGASGAFMFFTKDNRYIVKSCTSQETKCLLRILVPYADYVVNNKGSFLTRFLGLHSIKMYGKDYSFVVMSNIFNTNKVINQSYDIKGSWVNRHHDPIVKGKKVRCRHCNKHYIFRGVSVIEDCTEHVRGCQPNVVLKDNDLNEKIRLEVSDADKTIEQLVADSELLASLGIMDYSLIMGVCNTEYEIQDHKQSDRWGKGARRRSVQNSGGGGRSSLTPKAIKKRESQVRGASGSERDSCNESERGEAGESRRTSGEGEVRESDFMMRSRCVVGPEFVFMGMIDMLQEWSWDKQIERWAKIIFKRKDPDGISAIEPGTYKARFQGKIRAIFEVEGGLEGGESESQNYIYTPEERSTYARSTVTMHSPGASERSAAFTEHGINSLSHV